MSADNGVPIAMLLLKSARNGDTRSLVQAQARALGLVPTSEGMTSLSFRADRETFAHVFGVQAEKVEGLVASGADFGAPAGYHFDAELAVPLPLQEYVSQVTVSSPALRLSEAV